MGLYRINVLLLVKEKMKTPKILLISISLTVILSACNLPSSSGLPAQTADPNPVDTFVAMTLQAKPTQTKMVLITPVNTVPVATVTRVTTPIPPNTPAWLAYNYTCKLVTGGGDMTMNLSWVDRSTSEEGYKVYRDGEVIATLAPNSTYYVDVAFVATGKTLSYTVEAFNADWQASTSPITYGCE
jgi:hypothetical protein